MILGVGFGAPPTPTPARQTDRSSGGGFFEIRPKIGDIGPVQTFNLSHQLVLVSYSSFRFSIFVFLLD